MKKIYVAAMTLGLAAALAVPATSFACGGKDKQAMSVNPAVMTVAQVADLKAASKVTTVDANGTELRTTVGVIPGAVLLSNPVSYALSELPKDKESSLVFYCANTKCTASDQAAKRAMDNGYTNVAVLRAGILGWKKAGQPTNLVNQS